MARGQQHGHERSGSRCDGPATGQHERHDCGGAAWFAFSNYTGSRPHRIAFNVSINDCLTAATGTLYGGSTGTYACFNNTAVAKGTHPALYIGVTNYTQGMKIYNNIFVSASGVTTANIASYLAGLDLQGNAYLSGASSFSCTYNGSNSTSLAAWRTATGLEASSNGVALSAYPLLSSSIVSATPSTIGLIGAAYSLPQLSTLIGSGLNVAGLYGVTLPPQGDALGSPVYAGLLPVGAINSFNAGAGAMAVGP